MRRAFSLGAAFTDIAEAACSKHSGPVSEVVCMGDGLHGCPSDFYGRHVVCKDAWECDSDDKQDGETICKGPEACPTGQIRNAQGVCVAMQGGDSADNRGKPCTINGQAGVVDDNNDCVATPTSTTCHADEVKNAQGVCVKKPATDDKKDEGGNGMLWVAGAAGLALVAYLALKKK